MQINALFLARSCHLLFLMGMKMKEYVNPDKLHNNPFNDNSNKIQ